MKSFIQHIVFIVVGYLPYCYVSSQSLYSTQSININTRDYDEECAVPFNDGIVFLSNRTQSALVIRVDTSGKPLLDIFFARQRDNRKFTSPDIFSKELKSKVHESAVCFDKNGQTIWFTRVEDDSRTALFSATLSSAGWSNITAFQHNMSGYNFGHPNVSPDGKKLFFASNRPGGSGGRDIWVCNATRNGWGPPKNLGSEINSSADEYYPFYHSNGKLYFTSNRSGGYGGYDIYWSKEIDGKWIPSQRLESPVNSRFDDYCFNSDSADRSGYFSSNRNKSADIFSFTMDFPNFKDPQPIKKNTYNYKFKEESASVGNDTSTFLYEWDFGDGVKIRGRDLIIRHTFPSTGDYLVQLNVIDTLTGEVMLNQAANVVNVRDYEQPVITCADTAFVNDKIQFDALKTYLPNKKIKNHYWDMGDGLLLMGKNIEHSFFYPGKYRVILGITTDEGEKEPPGLFSVYKDIVILEKKSNP
jgi:hypothetical protein